MELRVLGAHNMESKDTGFASYLVDGVLVLDAGGLTRALTFEEQKGIRAVLLSHRHFDHVRDLLPLGIGLRTSEHPVDIYAIEDTVQFVSDKLLDGSLYPNFLRWPTPENPIFRLHTLELFHEYEILGYKVKPVPVPHTVPAAGFQISNGESNLFYTGDTGDGLSEAWPHLSPSTILVEVTFGNKAEEVAEVIGHLTPRLLEKSLADFVGQKGYAPKVIVAHINPPWEDDIRRELADVQERLGLDILVSSEGISVAV